MNLLMLWASLLAGYVFARTILPLPWRWRYKLPLLFFLLLIANKFHVLHLFGGPRAFASTSTVQFKLRQQAGKSATSMNGAWGRWLPGTCHGSAGEER